MATQLTYSWLDNRGERWTLYPATTKLAVDLLSLAYEKKIQAEIATSEGQVIATTFQQPTTGELVQY